MPLLFLCEGVVGGAGVETEAAPDSSGEELSHSCFTTLGSITKDKGTAQPAVTAAHTKIARARHRTERI